MSTLSLNKFLYRCGSLRGATLDAEVRATAKFVSGRHGVVIQSLLRLLNGPWRVLEVGPPLTDVIAARIILVYVPFAFAAKLDPHERSLDTEFSLLCPCNDDSMAPFLLARTEMSQRIYTGLNGAHYPYAFPHPTNPAESMSWIQAVGFLHQFDMRLPTSREWAYACRAGTSSRFHFGATATLQEANCKFEDVSLNRTVEVGSLPENPAGLFEMHGNVAEWCADLSMTGDPDFDDDPEYQDYRVVRGGSWFHSPQRCCSDSTDGEQEDRTAPYIGFRAAMSA